MTDLCEDTKRAAAKDGMRKTSLQQLFDMAGNFVSNDINTFRKDCTVAEWNYAANAVFLWMRISR